jgi:hypothetical protein
MVNEGDGGERLRLAAASDKASSARRPARIDDVGVEW